LSRKTTCDSSSPAVDAQAESFLAADAKLRMEIESRHLKPMSSARVNISSDYDDSFSNDSPCPKPASTPALSRTIDYHNPEEFDFEEFLGEGGPLEEWSVEAELKKPSSWV